MTSVTTKTFSVIGFALLTSSMAWAQPSGSASGGNAAPQSGLSQYAPPDICRAMISTIRNKPISLVSADMSTIGLLVTYVDSSGTSQNYKCSIDIVDGTASWATDSGAWHGGIQISTDAADRLIINVPAQQVETFSAQQLASRK